MGKFLKIIVVVMGLLIAGVGVLYWKACSNFSEAQAMRFADVPPVTFEAGTAGDVALGGRIVNIRNGCVECHGQDLGGANVINDAAFAKIDGPNITPAKLQSWTDGEIGRAVRHGIGKDNRPLMLMPSHEYMHISKSDLQATIAYIRQVPQVAKPNGEVAPGPVMRMLYMFGKMPTLFPAMIIDHKAGFVEKPAETESAEFGKYLVETSCTGCHGPQLKGGPIVGGDPSWPPAPDISAEGLAAWSVDDFTKALKTGTNPSGKKILFPMPIAMTSQFSDTELKSIWSYIAKRGN